MLENHHKVKEIKSVRIIVETDDGKEEFVTKKPCAMVASTLEKKGEAPIKGGIQLIGNKGNILFAYYMLTKQLIRVIGEKLVIKTLLHLFEEKVGDLIKEAEFRKRLMLKPKDKIVH